MKRGLVAVIIFFSVMCPVCADSEGRWEFHSELDLPLGLKAGAEYRFTDQFGLPGARVCVSYLMEKGHRQSNSLHIQHTPPLAGGVVDSFRK